MPTVIHGPVVMFVEGNDEILFFEALFAHAGIAGVTVLDVKGKGNFPSVFAAFILSPEFANVRAIAIVRDADDDHAATMASIQNLLRKHNQPVPVANKDFAESAERRIGIFVMPGNYESGMLEDLCLATVGDDPAMPCVDAAWECIRSSLPPKPEGAPDDIRMAYRPANPRKAKALLFLATRQRSMSGVGYAAKNGVWKLEHECLSDLKTFVTRLAAEKATLPTT